MPQVIYKPRSHYQNFFPLANRVYLIVIINKTLLRNGNCPIMNLLPKWEYHMHWGNTIFVLNKDIWA